VETNSINWFENISNCKTKNKKIIIIKNSFTLLVKMVIQIDVLIKKNKIGTVKI
jgi:hypothetical protein